MSKQVGRIDATHLVRFGGRLLRPETAATCARQSGRVVGVVLRAPSLGGFEVPLRDLETGESVDVLVPFATSAEVSALDRTVAFRAAIASARWRSRARRHGTRILVERVKVA